jgi:hypothetical protein
VEVVQAGRHHRYWRVFFDQPVTLRGMEKPYEVEGLRTELNNPEARYWWWAEDEDGDFYAGDALGAYMWGLRLIEQQGE